MFKNKLKIKTTRIFLDLGGRKPLTEDRQLWKAARFLACIAIGTEILAWPGIRIGCLIKTAWQSRRTFLTLLDNRLAAWATWARFIDWRIRRKIAHCDRAGHTLIGTVLEGGKPGKMCPVCQYSMPITPKEFKRTFRVSFNKAVKHAASE